jgi:hypothetical protein
MKAAYFLYGMAAGVLFGGFGTLIAVMVAAH